MARVFLSYSRNKTEMVHRIAEDLAAAKIEVWRDEWEIASGDILSQKTEEGLAGSDFWAVALTRSSVHSEWLAAELSRRVLTDVGVRRVVVIPLLFERCEMPTLLANMRYADFTGDFTKGLDEFVSIVRDYAAVVTPVVVTGRASLVEALRPTADLPPAEPLAVTHKEMSRLPDLDRVE